MAFKKADGPSLRKSFLSRSPQIYMKLFNTLVRPLPEYSSPVWNPQQVNHCKRIGAVQRRATRRISSLRTLPYKERLASLQMDSLFLRRLIADLILVYKITRRFTLSQCNLFSFASSRTRGHPFKVVTQFANRKFRRHFFTIRVIKEWNSLPSHIVTCDSLSAFKTKLTSYLRKKYS